MKKILLAILIHLSFAVVAQSKNEKAIREMLSAQTEAWSSGDLDKFMNDYWQSDSLMFIGKNGVMYGWKGTLNNYKRGYPDRAAMGTLISTVIKIERLSKKNYFVVGKWSLKRSIGDVGGHYTLLVRKIKGRWLIVGDHSS